MLIFSIMRCPGVRRLPGSSPAKAFKELSCWIFRTTCWGHSMKVLCPQIPRKTGDAKNKALSFQKNGCKTCSLIQKAGTWRWLTVRWSVLSVGPGHVKLQQLDLEVDSNLSDPYCQRLPHAPIAWVWSWSRRPQTRKGCPLTPTYVPKHVCYHKH